MSFYDIVMIALFGGAILFGAWKGLAWQIASVAAIFVSYLVALNFREPVSSFIPAEEPWNRFGAMLALFLGTSLAIWLIFGRVKATINKMHLKGFDRQAGALLGAAKGALLCMVVTMFSVTLLGETARSTIISSRTGGFITNGIDKLTAVVPDEIHQVLKPHLEKYYNAMAGGDDNPQNDSNLNPNGGSWDQGFSYGNPSQPTNNPYGYSYPYPTNTNGQTNTAPGQYNGGVQPYNPSPYQNSSYSGQPNYGGNNTQFSNLPRMNQGNGTFGNPSSTAGQGSGGEFQWPQININTKDIAEDLINKGIEAVKDAADKKFGGR